MLNNRIGVIDYRMGNLTSVMNAIESLSLEAVVASDPEVLEHCSHIILPGVGSFTRGMAQLDQFGFTDAIRTQCGEKQKPLLGICLGMQLLADFGFEGGETAGLGLIPGCVRKLETNGLPLPHIGW